MKKVVSKILKNGQLSTTTPITYRLPRLDINFLH